MSPSPANAIGAVNPAEFAGVDPTSAPVRPTATISPSAKPDRNHFKTERNDPADAPSSSELHRDEVQVQRESGTDGEIIIRYVDRFGDLVLQVPSAQVLVVSPRLTRNLPRKRKLEPARIRRSQNTKETSMGIGFNPSTLLDGQGIDVNSLVHQVMSESSGQLTTWQNELRTLQSPSTI